MRNEEEKRAFISAGTDDRNLMVEAGAGAGKTHLLVDRILNQIEHNVCEIQEIVAITFTRKAASEMKERLQKELIRRSEKLPHSSSLKKAMENIHRMNISTIHSFCGEMIRSRPCDSEVGMEYDLLEAEDFEAVLVEFERAYLSEDHVEDRELAQWISDLSIYPNLKKDFDRVLLNGGLDFRIPPKSEFHSMLSDFKTESALLFRSLKKLLEYGENSKTVWRKNTEALAKAAADLFESYQRTESGRALLSFLSMVEKMLKEGASSSKHQLSDLKKATILTAKNEALAYDIELELLQAVQNCWEKRRAMEYALCVWSLQDFKEYYVKKNLAGATALSNSELLYYAVRIAEKEDARRFFQRRYRRFYIDEFQDTDPIQAKLFLSLACENSGELRDVPMEDLRMLPGRLFVVGDPKQSIYRFRGADLNVYNRVKRIFLSQETAEVIELDKTFRYHKGLGDEVFSIFSRTEEDHYGFGETSPSGIGFSRIQTDREHPPAEMFQGVQVIRSNRGFNGMIEEYLARVKERLQQFSASDDMEAMFREYESELKEILAWAYVKRMEKFLVFEPTEKSGNQFKKDFLQKVRTLLEGNRSADVGEEELYPSLKELGGERIQQCQSFQTFLALLELRMADEESIEEEVGFLVQLDSLKKSEDFKSVASEEKKSPLMREMKEGMISEIPAAVQKTILQLVGKRKLSADSLSNGESASVCLRDILVLTRQKDMLSKIGAVLRESGIPYRSTEQRGFEEYASIRTLMMVAELAERFSTERLLPLLSAAYGWSSKELKQFQREADFMNENSTEESSEQEPSFVSSVKNWQKAAKNLAQISPAFISREKELASLLRLFRFNSESVNNVGAESPLALLETFLLQREVLLYGMDSSGCEGEDEINAAYLFLQMLRDSDPVTVGQVAERMRMLIKRTVEHQFVPDPKEDALRLMNLHKAKGLEGKIVLLVGEADHTEKSGPYFHSESNRVYLEFSEAREKGNRFGKIDYENCLIAKQEIEEAREASVLEAKEEKIRLDYVAVTRAREAVIVIDPQGCYDSALLKTLHLQRMELKSSMAPTFIKKTRIPYAPVKRETCSAVGGIFLKTPSDIEAGDVSLHGTDRKRPTGAEFGTIVHRAFERMVRAKLEERPYGIEEAVKFSVEEFVRENSPTRSMANLLLMGKISLEEMKEMDHADRVRCVLEILEEKTIPILERVWLQKISPRIDESVKAYTELPFVLAVPVDSEEAREMTLRSFDAEPERFLIRGKMDLVLKRANGEFVVCDFKTNVLSPNMSVDEFRTSLREKYRYQMKLYTQAITKLFGVDAENIHSLIIDLY